MSGIAILRPGQRLKALVLAIVAAGVLLGGGVAVGYASSRSKATATEQQPTAQAQQQSTAIQLPTPDSSAARQLLADPNTPGWLQDVYTHQSDSTIITAEHTAALLKLLQDAVQASTAAAAAASPRSLLSIVRTTPASVSSVQQHLQLLSAYQSKFLATPSSSSSTAVDLQPFITATGDILSYLRFQQSQALLPLLRDFSRSGRKGLAFFSADPSLLRLEVQQLLQPASLQQWYVDAARSRVGATQQLTAGSQALPWEAHTQVLPVQSPVLAASAFNSRRLMAASGSPQDLASALLSKMQGAASPAAPPAADTYDAPAAAAHTPAVSSADAAEWGQPPVQFSPRVSQNAAARSASNAPSRPHVSAGSAAVPAPAPGTIGASAVADPDYLAFDFEDLGADGDSFSADSDADVPQQATSSSSSSGARSRAAGSLSRQGNASSASKQGYESGMQGQGQAGMQSVSNAAPAASPAATVASPGLAQLPLLQNPTSNVPGPSSTQATLQVMRPSMPSIREAGSSSDAAAAAAVCGIQQFSPTGLQQVSEALLCPAPHLSLYSQGGGVFRPVVIPVVFHCLTFTRVLPSSARPSGTGPVGPDAQVLLPPAWQATTEAGQNLIDQANKVFFNTGIQIELQEVRTDSRSHPYLQQPNLEAWQSCSHNTAAPASGLACLQRVASQLASTASAQAVHVIVSGSREEAAYCSPQDVGMGSVCGSVASGCSAARGPWTGAVASGWKEDAISDNFVFLSWDTFNPATTNAARFANRGGSILASQLAQHLGLASTIAAASAVPGGCSPQQQLPGIASWCSAFRQGMQLSLKFLSAASNCPASPFAVMEPSVPDSCAMSFAPSQVATLQAAVALYRPKLLAATATK